MLNPPRFNLRGQYWTGLVNWLHTDRCITCRQRVLLQACRKRRMINRGDLRANQIRCHCLGTRLTNTGQRRVLHHSTTPNPSTPATWTTASCALSLSQTHLSKTSRIIKMQNAKGHARYRSSACGNVASSVFFKSAQVTLCGSQNRSFQNHARIPAISLQHAL